MFYGLIHVLRCIRVRQNVMQVFSLSNVELDGVNEAYELDGYSASSFEPGVVMVVSGDPVVQGAW